MSKENDEDIKNKDFQMGNENVARSPTIAGHRPGSIMKKKVSSKEDKDEKAKEEYRPPVDEMYSGEREVQLSDNYVLHLTAPEKDNKAASSQGNEKESVDEVSFVQEKQQQQQLNETPNH